MLMEIPTVKSWCGLNLRTAGLFLGYLQAFIFTLAMLVNMYYRAYPMMPIFWLLIAAGFIWNRGIRQNKRKLMLPTMILFALVSFGWCCLLATFTIAISLIGPIYAEEHECNPHAFMSGNTVWGNRCDTYVSYVDSKVYNRILAVWIASCVSTCIITYSTVIMYSVFKSIDENDTCTTNDEDIEENLIIA